MKILVPGICQQIDARAGMLLVSFSAQVRHTHIQTARRGLPQWPAQSGILPAPAVWDLLPEEPFEDDMVKVKIKRVKSVNKDGSKSKRMQIEMVDIQPVKGKQ